MLKKVLSILMAALLFVLPAMKASAATLAERLDAVEAEFGMSGEGSLSERIAALEAALGITPDSGKTTAERIAGLEKEAGFAAEGESGGPSGIPEANAVSLASLGAFSTTGVFTYFSPKQYEDFYKGVYTSTIFAETNWGFSDHVVEYLIQGEYRELRGVFYIPNTLSSLLEDVDLLRVNVRIYGDDRLLYSMPVLHRRDEPQAFSINVSGVKFLKIEFLDAATISGPMVVLGNAELMK